MSENKPMAQYMVSAPKKNFAHAVDRNRIKRLMREALRLEKSVLEDYIAQQTSQRYIFALTYTGKKLPEFQQVSKSVQHLLNTWISKHEKDSKNIDLPTPTTD